MAYDRFLADKITQIMKQNQVNFYEKEMMGGITWVVEEKCASVSTKEVLWHVLSLMNWKN